VTPPLERVRRARTRLVGRVPFFGHLALSLRPRLARPGDGVATAAVARDGTLVLDEAFVGKLSDAELCGLLAHEVLHPALRFFERCQARDHRLFNVAHDFAINLLIAAMRSPDVVLPPGSLCDPALAGLPAEEIYERLAREGRPPRGSLAGDCRDDLTETPEGLAAGRGDAAAERRVETGWRIAVAVAAQAHESARGRGSLPAEIKRVVDGLARARVDWREQLSRWVGENGRRCEPSYRRPSRRSESIGEYLPTLGRWGTDEIVVIIDTSGSIEEARLAEAVSEVGGICGDLGIEVRVIIIDETVHGDLRIEDALALIPHLAGGGGSDLRAAFARLEDEGFPGCVVAFTDGAIVVPETRPGSLRGVLWVVREGETAPAPWGEVLEVPA